MFFIFISIFSACSMISLYASKEEGLTLQEWLAIEEFQDATKKLHSKSKSVDFLPKDKDREKKAPSTEKKHRRSSFAAIFSTKKKDSN